MACLVCPRQEYCRRYCQIDPSRALELLYMYAVLTTGWYRHLPFMRHHKGPEDLGNPTSKSSVDITPGMMSCQLKGGVKPWYQGSVHDRVFIHEMNVYTFHFLCSHNLV